MSIRRTAAAATVFAALAPVGAWAQQCPRNDGPTNGTNPPLPTVVSYGIQAVYRPANGTDVHYATLTGGHAIEGQFRIDLRLSADVPSNCDMPLEIFDPAVSVQDRDRRGETGRAGTALARYSREQVFNRYTIRTDGSNRASLTVETLATFVEQVDALAFTIGDRRAVRPPPAYGFTITRRPIPPMVVTATPNPVPAGGTVTVTAMMPGGLSQTAFANPVIFTVSPRDAGTLRVPPGVERPLPAPGSGGIVPPNHVLVSRFFTPQRTQMIFEPARTGITATITAETAGATRSVSVNLLNGPVVAGTGVAAAPETATASAPSGCDPVGDYQRVSGGIALTITNTGTKPCPAFRAEMRKGKGAYFDTAEVPALPPTAKMTTRPTVPSLASSGWTGTFQISDAELPVGTVIATRLVPSSQGSTAIELDTFTVPIGRGIIPVRN